SGIDPIAIVARSPVASVEGNRPVCCTEKTAIAATLAAIAIPATGRSRRRVAAERPVPPRGAGSAFTCAMTRAGRSIRAEAGVPARSVSLISPYRAMQARNSESWSSRFKSRSSSRSGNSPSRQAESCSFTESVIGPLPFVRTLSAFTSQVQSGATMMSLKTAPTAPPYSIQQRFQFLIDRFTRSEDPRAHRTNRTVHGLGDLLVRHPFQLTQHDRRTQIFGQLLHRAFHDFAYLLGQQH